MLLSDERICNRDSEINTHSLFDYVPHLASECHSGELSMHSFLTRVLGMFALLSLCACQSHDPQFAATPDTSNPVAQNRKIDSVARENAFALLDDLLNDEKNLSKILLIKRHSDQLGKLVEDISKTSKQGAESLETMAKEQGINLKRLALPPGETATREAISKSKESTLLHSKDEEFEFQLLLTQIEALNYGAYLAEVVAENEPQRESASQFSKLSAELQGLHERVLAMLRSKG